MKSQVLVPAKTIPKKEKIRIENSKRHQDPLAGGPGQKIPAIEFTFARFDLYSRWHVCGQGIVVFVLHLMSLEPCSS